MNRFGSGSVQLYRIRPSRIIILITYILFQLAPSPFTPWNISRQQWKYVLLPPSNNLCFCSRPLPCPFGRLVTREHFGCAHAPLLLIKAYGHSCVCFVSSLYVRSSCDEGAFRTCPCTSLPHKGVRAFVDESGSRSQLRFIHKHKWEKQKTKMIHLHGDTRY